MKYETIRQLLVDTTPDHWHRPEPAFPTYRDHLAALQDPGPIGQHDAVAVYRDDVRLSLAWGMPPLGHDNPITEGNVLGIWAPGPDPNVHSFLVDVFYCGGLVDRHMGATVDGHRAYLPFPNPTTPDGSDDPKDIEWFVSSWDVDLFRLIDGLTQGSGSEYDSYLDRADVTIR